MPDREALIARLLADNEEFRKLSHDHQGYEKELEELKGRPFLSADQQWRVSEVKKLKLMAKDRVGTNVRQASQTHSSPAPACSPRPEGEAHTVDVAAKAESARAAVAHVVLRMKRSTLAAIKAGQLAKGDVLGVARTAGVLAAKRTSAFSKSPVGRAACGGGGVGEDGAHPLGSVHPLRLRPGPPAQDGAPRAHLAAHGGLRPPDPRRRQGVGAPAGGRALACALSRGPVPGGPEGRQWRAPSAGGVPLRPRPRRQPHLSRALGGLLPGGGRLAPGGPAPGPRGRGAPGAP